MEAILWDGHKQLKGTIKFNQDTLAFIMDDFELTNLNFQIEYKEIDHVSHFRLYDITNEGIEIICKDGKQNIFIVDDRNAFRKIISEKISLSKQTF